MKKGLLLIIGLILLVTITACTQDCAQNNPNICEGLEEIEVLSCDPDETCICSEDAEGNMQVECINMIVGGPCSYEDFEGECTFTSVEKTEESKLQSVYEGFEVKFTFVPSKELEEYVFISREDVGRENNFRLVNSWYPGSQYLEKYNIEEETVFSCTMSVMTDGTCSPVVFEFDEIDRIDYFESQ